MAKPENSTSTSVDQLAKYIKSKRSSADFSSPTFLDDGGFRSPLITLGVDELRLRRLIHWLRDEVFQGKIRAYFGSELTSTAAVKLVSQSLQTLSLFSTRELIVFYDADSVRANTAILLAQAISDSPPSSTVLLCFRKDETKSTLLSNLKSPATILQFAELRGPALSRWIEHEVVSNGIQGGIAPQAIELLIKLFGEDTFRLAQELSKISLLVPREGKIEKEAVERVVFQAPDHTSFELVNAISKRDLRLSTILTERLLDQGMHGLQLCSFLSRSFRTILAQTGLAQTGQPLGRELKTNDKKPKLAAELNNPWFQRNLSSTFKLFTAYELESSLELIKNLDFKLKDSKLNDSTLLLNAVERLASRNFPAEQTRYF